MSLPAHARLIARPDVWMEGAAIDQLARVASFPGCIAAAGMPDLHTGPGIPIGAAFAFADRIHPLLVGGDADCGVRLSVTSLCHQRGDALERRVDHALDDDPLVDCDPSALFHAAWHHGVRGLADLEGVPESFAAIAAAEPAEDLIPSAAPESFRSGFESALGTVGGGNHFAEISRVSKIHDVAAATALGLVRGSLVVLAHSGSRGLGAALAQRYGDRELTGADADAYLAELRGAVRFARANRFVIAYRLLRALGATRTSKLPGSLDLTHNDVALEDVAGQPAWIHRKGAAPARGSDFTVVLGSRGAASWILRSLNSTAGLRSVAHGAGRRMGRSEAREKLKKRYKRAELTRTNLGGRVLCADPELLYEEHPDAYKPIEPIIASVVEAGLATPVAELVPVFTVKR